MQPKVSVIIPIYNSEPYLRECLDSVIGQTLRDIEIICVNDGSTDGSGDIIAQYASHDSRIISLTQLNAGQSAARNSGISIARGEYLYFFDSDDLIIPETLEELYAVASRDRLDNVYFDASVFFDSPEVERANQNYVSYYNRKGDYPDIYTGCELFALMHPVKDYRPSPCLQLIRRQFLVDSEIHFREGIILEDNLFTFMCITQAKAVRYIKKAYFSRRVRASSTMTSVRGTKRFDGYFTVLSELLDYVDGRDFGEANGECARFILSIYRNAATEYHRLPMDIRGDIVPRKSIRDEYLFSMILGNIAGTRPPAQIPTCKNCELVNSFSYRIGRVITFIPRKIYRGFLCIADHGVVYTIKLFFKKLLRRG